jgi:hypothetical protein
MNILTRTVAGVGGFKMGRFKMKGFDIFDVQLFAVTSRSNLSGAARPLTRQGLRHARDTLTSGLFVDSYKVD